MSELLRVLVLEDNPADFGVIRRLLRKLPDKQAEAIHILDPDEAFKFLMENEVDCILLDYLLGAVTGVEFLKKLRTHGNDTPVVLLSGHGNEQIAVEALQCGAQDYLVKQSVTLQSLHRAMNSAIQQVSLQRKLLQQEQDLRQFVAIASHDIKSPLNRISLLGEALKSELGDRLNEDEAYFLNEILNNAKHLQGFLAALLKHTRDGERQEAPRRVDLTEILAQAETQLAHIIEETGASIVSVDIPPVLGEPFALLQLLQNLLGNSLKYRNTLHPPSISIKVEAADTANKMWKFSVSDNGIGIQEDFYERIFRPMIRLHSTDAYEGYGIGLSTCQKVVERHGGSIWVEGPGEGGEGTTICFTLPQIPAESTASVS